MKQRRHLSPDEVDFLELSHNKIQKGKNRERHSLTNEQYNLVLSYRLNNKKKDFVETVRKFDKDGAITSRTEKLQKIALEEVPEGFEIIKLSTNTTSNQQWVQAAPIKDSCVFEADFDYLKELKKELKGVKKFKRQETKGKRVGVATLTDIHFGAYISGLNITPEYNITILCEKLNKAAYKINRFNYDLVHIHLLGDLIESFTGLNHKNSWKGLDKGMFGVKAIKLFVELFKKHFLDKVDNLGLLKLVAGNHDRVTSDSKEDADGGAAELVAWGLDMLGYDIEFNRAVITHKVGTINHILGHGHLFMMSKKTTQELCWMYGEKGCFNYIKEGHLHSRIRKLSAKAVANFKMVTDDSIDSRREVISSFFTGNQFSEDGGWSTLAGFSISEESGKNRIDVYDLSL